jgi:hypothetical protein
MDEGTGETILISHGIFGGYDQAYVSLKSLVGDDFRKIAPSRFCYPGSDVPSQPIPENQAKAFLNLLNQLGIKKHISFQHLRVVQRGLCLQLSTPSVLRG